MKILFGQRDYVERIKAYAVTDEKTRAFVFPLTNGDPQKLSFDISLYDNELQSLNKNVDFIVAFTAKYQIGVEKHLRNMGFSNIHLYDADMDNALKREFFQNKFRENGEDFITVEMSKKLAVYMAKSIYDKHTVNYPTKLPEYITVIQVGAALTEEKIAAVTDNTGENISAHNRHFSEMTAFYWLWKNAKEDFIGICHYRRIWKNLDFIAGRLQAGDIDAVLPVPTLSLPSVRENYFPRFIPQVGDVFLQVLNEFSPEYFATAEKIFADNMYYSCNMCILQRETLNDLCKWMFPIVFEVERQVGDLPDSYYNRYCGFCTELLITLYFRANRQNWRIAHADKIFIG